MSALRFSLRSTLVAGIVGVMSLNAAACSDASTNPRGVPAANVAGSPAMSTTDRATLDSLRAPHQWIADLHHEAMQEVLHDPGISQYTGTGLESPACAAQTRYMERYARRVDTLLVSMHAASRGKNVSVADIAPRVGACRTALASDASLPNTRVGQYASSLMASIAAARSLDDALDATDQVLLAAAHDASITHDELSAVAALTTLARSSATEWYTHAQYATTAALNAGRPVTAWTVSTNSDLGGCTAGGTADATCLIGGIAGSLFSW